MVAASGFVVYRYRQTRALSLGQFFEMRYSRRFRLFMGVLAFVAGILNYGIFPAASSHFFVYFMDLPQTVSLGLFHIQTTTLIMASYLTCVVLVLSSGGHITQMVAGCYEGIISLLVLLIMIGAMLAIVGWTPVVDILGHQPPQKSMLNPFDAWQVQDFNIWFVLISLATTVYGTMAFQNTAGFNAAARNAHELRMASMLGNWRLNVRILLLLSITTIAFAFLKHPSFPAGAQAQQVIAGISDPQVQKQMRITIALRYLLPPGLRGLFCSTMVMGLIAGDCTHMHSWASIFIQDVVLPIRKRPMTTRQHLWALRASLVGVALFAFLFSLLFTLTHYIAMWWQITGGIFISGAGAAIIGGLYWRKGTTGAAWCAVLFGAILALTGILLSEPHIWAFVLANSGLSLPAKFPFNGAVVAFFAMAAASSTYVLVSLATCKVQFNLDRMLHRGEYAPADDPARNSAKRSLFARIANIDESFTRRDRWTAIALVSFTLLLAMINIGVVILNASGDHWSTAAWSRFWLIFGVTIPFALGTFTFVWFTIGGIRDTRDFFRALRS